jgi:hypothetical protein
MHYARGMRRSVAITIFGVLVAACGSTSGGPAASLDDAAVDAAGTCTDPAPACAGCCGSPEQASCANGAWECPGVGVCFCTPGDAGSGPIGGPCKGGLYTGSFGGRSDLSPIGAGVPVVGDVQLSLDQVGTANQTCSLQGESEPCSDLFSVHDGVVLGTGGSLFSFSCTLTGTLECKSRRVVDGWLDCAYCVEPLADGGMACGSASSDGGADGGVTTAGGHFAGPLTADYFYNSTGGDGGAGAIDGGGSGPPAFGTLPPPYDADAGAYDPGTWNGSEALAAYSGTGPLPDGGSLDDYLSDAGYGGGDAASGFGASGWWYVTYQHP